MLSYFVFFFSFFQVINSLWWQQQLQIVPDSSRPYWTTEHDACWNWTKSNEYNVNKSFLYIKKHKTCIVFLRTLTVLFIYLFTCKFFRLNSNSTKASLFVAYPAKGPPPPQKKKKNSQVLHRRRFNSALDLLHNVLGEGRFSTQLFTFAVGGRRWSDTFSAAHTVDQSEVGTPRDAYFEPEQQTDRDAERAPSERGGARLALTPCEVIFKFPPTLEHNDEKEVRLLLFLYVLIRWHENYIDAVLATASQVAGASVLASVSIQGGAPSSSLGCFIFLFFKFTSWFSVVRCWRQRWWRASTKRCITWRTSGRRSVSPRTRGCSGPMLLRVTSRCVWGLHSLSTDGASRDTSSSSGFGWGVGVAGRYLGECCSVIRVVFDKFQQGGGVTAPRSFGRIRAFLGSVNKLLFNCINDLIYFNKTWKKKERGQKKEVLSSKNRFC